MLNANPDETTVWALMAVIIVIASLGSLVIRQVYVQITYLVQKLKQIRLYKMPPIKTTLLTSFSEINQPNNPQKLKKLVTQAHNAQIQCQKLKENYQLLDGIVLGITLIIATMVVISLINFSPLQLSHYSILLWLKANLLLVCTTKSYYIIRALLVYYYPLLWEINFYEYQQKNS